MVVKFQGPGWFSEHLESVVDFAPINFRAVLAKSNNEVLNPTVSNKQIQHHVTPIFGQCWICLLMLHDVFRLNGVFLLKETMTLSVESEECSMWKREGGARRLELSH